MTRDKDEDLIALKKRIITGLLVGIAVVIPAVFCFGYRFRHDVKSAYYKIRRQDSFVLFLYDVHLYRESELHNLMSSQDSM